MLVYFFFSNFGHSNHFCQLMQLSISLLKAVEPSCNAVEAQYIKQRQSSDLEMERSRATPTPQSSSVLHPSPYTPSPIQPLTHPPDTQWP